MNCIDCGEWINFGKVHVCSARSITASLPAPEFGSTPILILTEADVRRIVREELAKEPKNG